MSIKSVFLVKEAQPDTFGNENEDFANEILDVVFKWNTKEIDAEGSMNRIKEICDVYYTP